MFASKATRSAWGRRIAAVRDEQAFGRLALELFAAQVEGNKAYRSFARRVGALPAEIDFWKKIPAVPQELFKRDNFFCHPLAKARHLYLTSGTTTGARGVNRLLDIDLYRQAALGTVADLGPFQGRTKRFPLFFITPSPRLKPTSSLSAMFGFFKQKWGAPESAFFVEEETLQLPRLRRALEKAVAARQPVGLLGTAFGFVHLLDGGGPSLRLPKGSFLLETGGFKGRSREVSKAELYRALSTRFGVPQTAIWNEYGMTELSGQAYAHGPNGEHQTSPWARVIVFDPATGEEVAVGERGLVRWIDLANVDGALAIETQDAAVRTRRGFRLIGRLPQATKRGCSLDAEELTTEAA